MTEPANLIRYNRITHKNPREIVLLRGSGCKWRRCKFCDYHLDFNLNPIENLQLNMDVLDKVTGKYNQLEVINSGSFSDLDENTITYIGLICKRKNIHTLYFECHWKDRANILEIRKRFSDQGTQVKIKGGVETFDAKYREAIFDKGIDTDAPEEIAKYYDEVCLLFGTSGQTEDSMKADIETGLKYFQRICINIMVQNTTRLKPDSEVISIFKEKIYPLYEEDPRVDILLDNTDFGVGGKNE